MKPLIKKGQKFGRLEAIEFHSRTDGGRQVWLFRCDCGNKKVSVVTEVKRTKRNGTKSCGCLAEESRRDTATKHGMKKSRLYSIWAGMKTRCLNKNHAWFKHYGGKGIGICDKWMDFIGFHEDMRADYEIHLAIYGLADTTLDRIDNSKGYSKSNCRWSTKLVQSNNASNNVMIDFNGKKQSIKMWSEEIGIKYGTLYGRLNAQKMSISKALQPHLLNRKNK